MKLGLHRYGVGDGGSMMFGGLWMWRMRGGYQYNRREDSPGGGG